MSKICAFFGNDYDFMRGRKRERRPDSILKEKIKAEIINLIENNDVSTFLVGEIGGFEEDAYDTVLEIKKIYSHIKIILIISKISELHKTGIDFYIHDGKYFDEWIYPDKCAAGCKKLSIVYRNNYIIEHTDFIIAYNKIRGRAYRFCQDARNKGITVIELYQR